MGKIPGIAPPHGPSSLSISLLQPEKSRKKTRYLKNLKNKGKLIKMRKKRKYLIPELRIFLKSMSLKDKLHFKVRKIFEKSNR
jgi:hypothetical protein